MELDSGQVLAIYSQRWGIEDFFEELLNQYDLHKFPGTDNLSLSPDSTCSASWTWVGTSLLFTTAAPKLASVVPGGWPEGGYGADHRGGFDSHKETSDRSPTTSHARRSSS
jgi:hypothetical protein